MAQIAVLQIKVLDGEGAVHSPGVRVARPLTVEVTDDAGKPVTGAAVSFQLPPAGPGGLFANGLRTDLILTDASGRAALHSLQLNRTAGQFRIRITAVKEQARAGAISTQYIGGNQNAPAPLITAPPTVAAEGPPATSAQSGEITPTTASGRAAATGEITPTAANMGPGIGKKWMILAAIAAGAGAALAGVVKMKSSGAGSSSSGSGSTSAACSATVCIGAPTVTIGHP